MWRLDRTSFNSTINGPLSHRVKILCLSHPSLCGNNFMSKFHSIRARMTRISFSANAFPRQLRGPTLNGCEAARLSRWNGEAGSIVEGESHRSGMKSACRWKFNGLFDAVHACTPTIITPPPPPWHRMACNPRHRASRGPPRRGNGARWVDAQPLCQTGLHVGEALGGGGESDLILAVVRASHFGRCFS